MSAAAELLQALNSSHQLLRPADAEDFGLDDVRGKPGLEASDVLTPCSFFGLIHGALIALKQRLHTLPR